jgi:fructose-1,6-bisphosphatase/inositol monophosphatase family enzyme
MVDLVSATEFAWEVAQQAGRAILPHFRVAIDVQNKDRGGGYDPVTIADREAESVIRDAIRARYPLHGLYGEEHGREAGSEPWTWVIDPIDGTKSFVLGQLHWGVLIALNDGARPVAGVAYQPFVGEAFVACADPRFFAPPREAAAYAAVTEGARFTRYGGDLYCYTQLAMGLADVVIETGLKPYDIQALMPVIERAGGVVTDWTGGDCQNGGDVLACGDPALHADLLRRIAARG